MFEILDLFCYSIIFVWVVCDVILFIRTKRYQKRWNKEKKILEKSIPKPSKADLCEQYVMFCLRNDCKVEF